MIEILPPVAPYLHSAALFIMCGALTIAGATVRAAKYLHKMLLKNILRSPMSFFDITPIGRIVNRFSKDIDIVDVMLPSNFRAWIGCFIAVSAIRVIMQLPIFNCVVLCD